MTQPLPLKEQLKALEQIQEIDLKIDALKKERDDLPLQLQVLKDQEQDALATLKTKQTAIEEKEKNQRQAKAAIELNQDRLTRSTSRLEQVQNSQEYQAVTKEIDQLKKMNAELEAQVQTQQTELETAQKGISEQQEKLSVIQKDREAKAQELEGQGQKLNQSIEALEGEKAPHLAQVEKRIHANYERIRGARNGLGLVPAVGGRCKGCNMVLPPQMYNVVQRGQELQQCPSCYRMLYS